MQHEEVGNHRDVIGMLHDVNLNTSTLSPMASGRTIDYNATLAAGDDSTQDMSRANAYKSAAKIRMHKKGSVTVSPSPGHSSLKPMVNPTWDNMDAGSSTLPNVKGAHR